MHDSGFRVMLPKCRFNVVNTYFHLLIGVGSHLLLFYLTTNHINSIPVVAQPFDMPTASPFPDTVEHKSLYGIGTFIENP
jgi:hypothetical protein